MIGELSEQQNYGIFIWLQAFRKSRELNVDKLKEPVLDEITRELVRQYGLSFTKQDVSSLWFLCKQVGIHYYCSDEC